MRHQFRDLREVLLHLLFSDIVNNVAVPYVGDRPECVSVNCSVISDDFVEVDGSVVLRDRHHFDTRFKTGTFHLIHHTDFDRVGFLGYQLTRYGPAAKVVLCFVGNSHRQVDNFYFLIVQGLHIQGQCTGWGIQ